MGRQTLGAKLAGGQAAVGEAWAAFSQTVLVGGDFNELLGHVNQAAA